MVSLHTLILYWLELVHIMLRQVLALVCRHEVGRSRLQLVAAERIVDALLLKLSCWYNRSGCVRNKSFYDFLLLRRDVQCGGISSRLRNLLLRRLELGPVNAHQLRTSSLSLNVSQLKSFDFTALRRGEPLDK